MSFLTIFNKLQAQQKLLQETLEFGNSLATGNVIGMTDAFQDEGANNEYRFPDYVNDAKRFRSDYAKMLVKYISIIDRILLMMAQELNSSGTTDEQIIRDIQKHMDDTPAKCLSRDITRGDITYETNAGVIVSHSTDWLGYAIETDRTPCRWNVVCSNDMHDSSKYYYGGSFTMTPVEYVDTTSGDALVDANTVIETFNAVNYSSSGLILGDTFSTFSATTGFSNWESDNWSDISQDTTEFVYPRLGTRTSTLPDGAGDAAEFAEDRSMWRYLNADRFDRYTPYITSVAYRHEDATADGRITLTLGSQTVQSPADGLAGAATGTTTFANSVNLVGAGTKYLSELKPGDLIWNSTDDTIADARVIASVTDDVTATLTVAYASGNYGAGKNLSSMHTGWHRLYMVKYLDEFWTENLYTKVEKTGHGANSIYLDDHIIKGMNFYTQAGRYVEVFADQVAFEKDDRLYWTDSQAVDQGFIQYWWVRNFGISLPHDDPATAGYGDET